MRKHWIVAGALLALGATTGLAQGRGHGRGNEPPGQAKKAERQEQAQFAARDRDVARNWLAHERRDIRDARDDEARGDDGDRAEGERGKGERGARGGRVPPGQANRELPPGLRGRDRLPPGIERKLQAGYLLSGDDRRLLYPAPVILVRQFSPPPPGYRYFAFGGHIVLVDGGWRVHDVIHLEIAGGN